MKRLRRTLTYILALWRPTLRLERSPERTLMPLILTVLTVLATLAAVQPIKTAADETYALQNLEGHLVVHMAQGTTPTGEFQNQLTALVARLEQNKNIAHVSVATGPDLAETLGMLFGVVDQEDQLYGGIVRLDLRERAGHDANVENIQREVKDFNSANVSDFRVWKEANAKRTYRALWEGLFVIALTFTLVAAILNLTIRLGLRMHQRTLMILHHLGATDAFAAMLFQAVTFQRALIGVLGGGMLSAGMFWVHKAFLKARGDYPGVDYIGPWQITIFILVPLIQLVLAVAIARQTALRALKQTY